MEKKINESLLFEHHPQDSRVNGPLPSCSKLNTWEGSQPIVLECDPQKIVLNDQGGQIMDVSYDCVCTLRAQTGGHHPLVMEKPAYTLKVRGGVEVDSNGHGAGKGPFVPTDLSATLGVSMDQTLFVPKKEDDMWSVCGTQCATYCKGVQQEQVAQGQILPVKKPNCYVNTDRSGYAEGLTGATLRACRSGEENIIVYGMNSLKDNGPEHGIYEAEVSKTLDLNGGNPNCNQGGMMVCEPISQPYTFGDGQLHQLYPEDKAGALNCMSGQQNVLMRKDMSYQEKTGTLMANSHPGGTTGQDPYNDMCITERKEDLYDVRRLTPIECARLQGFPDDWCADVPHGDSAEYKLWGNGMALPCSLYIMEGIADLLGVEV